jgi:hypothetical protein
MLAHANALPVRAARGMKAIPALENASHATPYRGMVSPMPQELPRPERIGTRGSPRFWERASQFGEGGRLF